MMQGLAGAISQALSDIGQEASKPTADWTHQHPSARDELPFRQQVKHMDHGVDRPTSLPLAHRISLMDEHVVVELGSEMGVGNLLQGDWFRHYGRVQGSHPWDSKSLTSRQHSIKRYKCLSPVGRRITHSPRTYSGEFDNALGPHQKMEPPRGNPFSSP